MGLNPGRGGLARAASPGISTGRKRIKSKEKDEEDKDEDV